MMPPRERTHAARVTWLILAAVGIYVAGDVASGLRYAGYSFRDQAISELTAFGSPVRPLMMAIMLTHGALLAAAGVSLFRRAAEASVRWTGAFLAAANLGTLPTHTVWAMSSRWMQSGLNDAMHATTTVVFGVFVAAAMGCSAVAYPGWFRFLTLVLLAVIIGFGVASASAMTGLAQNDTPWAGAFERVNCYSYFVWLVVLAGMLRTKRRLVHCTR